MAAYNGQRFLEEQLRTLSGQVRLPDEVVICDDASTDRTPEILAQFAREVQFPVRARHQRSTIGLAAEFYEVGLALYA
jgi:glycosyltransferase involved in cell wall biosynthesis